MSNNMDSTIPGNEKVNLAAVYEERLNKYRDLLTTKIFEKTEQIKEEYRIFARTNGLTVTAVPDSLEAYEGDKLKIKLSFLKPMPDRAQIFLTVYFTSPKEFYINIYHTSEILSEVFSGENITQDDLNRVDKLHNELQTSDVFLSYYDRDRISDSREDEKFNSFMEILEELYRAPRKF
jgi:hypothetical protein